MTECSPKSKSKIHLFKLDSQFESYVKIRGRVGKLVDFAMGITHLVVVLLLLYILFPLLLIKGGDSSVQLNE